MPERDGDRSGAAAGGPSGSAPDPAGGPPGLAGLAGSAGSAGAAGAAPVGVLIADDHPVYREGAVRVMSECADLRLAAAVGDGAEALAEIRRLRPAVAVVDLRLPSMDGIAVAEAVQRENLGTRVVIVSAYEDGATVHRAFAAGVKAYLSKLSSAEVLRTTVLAVARGETVVPDGFDAALAGGELKSRHARSSGASLSARETEVLRLIAQGLSAPEIAEQLFVGVTTVKTHLQHIYDKFDVCDRAAAVAQAHRRGLIT
jgi:two-component system nitrate/nitrite response regulator NarL